MKAISLLALILLRASVAFGQGYIDFSTPATVRISTGNGLQISGFNSYYFALFVAPTSVGTNYSLSVSQDPTLNGFTFVGAYGTNTSQGRMSGNPTVDGVSVPGYAAGSLANFVVVGWSANVAGPDWSAIQPWLHSWELYDNPQPFGWAGHSYVADSVVLQPEGAPVNRIFGTAPGLAPGFTLWPSPIPEPSIVGLWAIGTVLLAIRHGRRS